MSSHDEVQSKGTRTGAFAKGGGSANHLAEPLCCRKGLYFKELGRRKGRFRQKLGDTPLLANGPIQRFIDGQPRIDFVC